MNTLLNIDDTKILVIGFGRARKFIIIGFCSKKIYYYGFCIIAIDYVDGGASLWLKVCRVLRLLVSFIGIL